MNSWPTLFVATALLYAPGALACGGFFCNRDFPIDQKAERIVFGVDEAAGEVTTHVQIEYSGASEDFAWVVPVASVPDLFVSSDALFTTLSSFTAPQFWLTQESMGICELGIGVEYELQADGDDVRDGEGVTVVAEEQVGPYDTVVLQATGTTELLDWLQDAGYDLPNELDPVLAPYIAQDQYFVALKLSAGNDVGDLAPLGMRYPGTTASIPIQLTSIAARPDMRLEVYVLGDARAVPDNYLHVTINEAAIDWFNGGSNYNGVVSAAADEAGGHAFATDFAGSTASFRGTLWDDARYDLDPLRDIDDPALWVQALMDMGFPPSAALLQVFMDLIPFPDALMDQGVTPPNFYDCLSCYGTYIDATGFDGETATDLLEERVVEGLRQAEDLLGAHDHLSRMTSSLDAAEMTVDPVFVFNRDLPQSVDNIHQATVEIHCGMGEGWDGAERTLVLSDGREIGLPSTNWLERHAMTELEAVGDLALPAAILIENYGATGEGEVLFDWRDEAAREARRFNRAGCGCATGAGSSSAIWALLGSVVLLRRRRR